MSILTRATRPFDMTYLRRWLNDPRTLPYLPVSQEDEVEQMIGSWAFFARYQAGITAILHHVPCGMATLLLMPYKKTQHQCTFYVCVDPAYRKQGIGTRLIEQLMHLAKEQFHIEGVYIDVFGNNPLLSILPRQGFISCITQKQYIKTDQGYEDRTVWIRALDGQEWL